MWYPATVTVPATAEPVTIAQVKAQLHIAAGDTSRDAELALLIAAARGHVEKYCGIPLMLRTVRTSCDSFAAFDRFLPAPLKSITSIAYVDLAGNEQALDSSAYDYYTDGLMPSVVIKHGKRWPDIQPGSRITVEAVVGFDAVPEAIIAALLLTVAKFAAFSREDLLIRTEQVEDVGSTTYSGAVEVTGAIDGIARDLLENYRNWAL